MQIKGAVACGHDQTANAAARILSQGGNAFDAVVAAHFAACVAEPVLASLGGGGFLLAHPTSGKTVFYDFFAQTPRQKLPVEDIDFYPIDADFGETTQEFHIGMGSIATPGAVRGMCAIHKDLCSLPMPVLLEPAIELARDGVIVNEFQAYIFDIIKPIYHCTAESYAIYRSQQAASGHQPALVTAGEKLAQPALADTLEALGKEGERLFYEGEIAQSVIKACAESGGYLRYDDFTRYEVIKREPLQLSYRDHTIFTNPAPSSGGLLIAFALKLLESCDFTDVPLLSEAYVDRLSYIMHLTNKARIESSLESGSINSEQLLAQDYIDQYQQHILHRYAFSRGTTHISVIDKRGNVASLTVSNGEGSSYIAPGTGIMFNNMLGEEDLNPRGFHQWTPNQRISSMMAPTILYDVNNYAISLGSGGSNRIRTAILQVLIQLLDFKLPLASAVDAPRIHFENGLLNMETGFGQLHEANLYDAIKDVKYWTSRNLFFGGVHAVLQNGNNLIGKGDPRRGGVAVVV
jgi:gamma-glutamyltranspeptidase/glutathione hydrolase